MQRNSSSKVRWEQEKKSQVHYERRCLFQVTHFVQLAALYTLPSKTHNIPGKLTFDFSVPNVSGFLT